MWKLLGLVGEEEARVELLMLARVKEAEEEEAEVVYFVYLMRLH